MFIRNTRIHVHYKYVFFFKIRYKKGLCQEEKQEQVQLVMKIMLVYKNLMWRSFNCDFVAFLWFEFVENRQ